MLTCIPVLFTATAVDHELFVERVDIFKRALALDGMTVEKASRWMGINESLLWRQLQGDGHISFSRMCMLPVSFWCWFGLLLLESYGLPREAQKAARFALAFIGRRRMAKGA